MTEILDRIRASLVGLRMARALEALDHTLRRLERGEITAIEAIDGLLAEEHVTREGRRVTVAVKTARLMPIKTLESFDFSFQPSLDRGRILALAQLRFIERAEVVHLLGPPGTGKSHLATALGVEAVRAGKRVYRASLAEIIDALSRAERDGRLPSGFDRAFCDLWRYYLMYCEGGFRGGGIDVHQVTLVKEGRE